MWLNPCRLISMSWLWIWWFFECPPLLLILISNQRIFKSRFNSCATVLTSWQKVVFPRNLSLMVGEIPQSVSFSIAKNGINERHLNRFKATCFGMCLLVKSSVGSSIPQRGLVRLLSVATVLQQWHYNTATLWHNTTTLTFFREIANSAFFRRVHQFDDLWLKNKSRGTVTKFSLEITK